MRDPVIMTRMFSQLLAVLSVSLLASAVNAETESAGGSQSAFDPLERYNRWVFSFNEFLDEYALRPVAEGYRNFVPDPIDQGITNFFNNLDDVGVLVNSGLQLKGRKSVATLSRLMFNTTLGIGGLFDVGTAFGLPKEDEDFGQTLGFWGVGAGPYLMLPALGPSTLRDAVGRVPDAYLEPTYYLEDEVAIGLTIAKAIDTRADLIPVEGFIVGDKYQFIRNAYLQRREYLVQDGAVEDPFANDEEFDEDFEF